MTNLTLIKYFTAEKPPVINVQGGMSCETVTQLINDWWNNIGHWQYYTKNIRDCLAVLIGFEVFFILLYYSIDFVQDEKTRIFLERCHLEISQIAPLIRVGLVITTICFTLLINK